MSTSQGRPHAEGGIPSVQQGSNEQMQVLPSPVQVVRTGGRSLEVSGAPGGGSGFAGGAAAENTRGL